MTKNNLKFLAIFLLLQCLRDKYQDGKIKETEKRYLVSDREGRRNESENFRGDHKGF